MITSLAWIPRGAARERPVRFELSSEEYSRIKELAKEEEVIEAEQEHIASGDTFGEDVVEDDAPLPAELHMDDYDDDEDNVDEGSEEDFDMQDHGDIAFALDANSDDEDAADDEIRDNDALIVVAMTEDEYSHLEIHLLSEDGNMFVHHDISLPDFPLCLAWTDCPPSLSNSGGQSAVGNYIAVGTFSPGIEIWNLDVLDPLEPTAVLGGEDPDVKPSRKKSKKHPTLKPNSHQEAVMGLSWNKVFRQAMASGSADKSVKIWDITTQECSHTFTYHKDKVQSVQWHPEEAWLLATGSFDQTVSLVDCRTASLSLSYEIAADIESMTWNPFNPYALYCALEDGQVVCLDIRQTQKALFAFQAHDKTTSCVSFSSSVPGMLATASVDKTVRVWDTLSCDTSTAGAGDGVSVPQLIAYKTMNVGKLLALQYYQSNPFMMATAGDKGMVAVWESDELQVIQDHFGSRVTRSREPCYSALAAGMSDMSVAAEPLGAAASSSASASSTSASTFVCISDIIQAGVVAAPTAEDDSWMDEPVDSDQVKKEKKHKKHSKKDKKEKH